jgi:hypothetical protein
MSDPIVIIPGKWKLVQRGYEYKCRICNKPCDYFASAITTPRGSYYHLWCVHKSPSYQRALKKHLLKQQHEILKH